MSNTPTLTDRQKNARDARSSNVALKASAGCGKTTVLTERLLNELENGTPLGRIVAVTFTEKAARELRDRVRRACRERATTSGDSKKWRGILRELEAAPICTIHAFCAEILRHNAMEAGVEPGFEVLDAAVAPTLLDDAVEAFLRRKLADADDDLVQLAIDSSPADVRDRLGVLVQQRSRADLREWAELSAEEITARWKELLETDLLPPLLDRLREVAEPLQRLLLETQCTGPQMIERRRRLIDLLLRLIHSENVDHLLDPIRESLSLQGSRANFWTPTNNYSLIKDSFQEMRDSIKTYVDAKTIDEEATFREAEQCGRISRLALGAIDEFNRLKARDGLLDFDDLLLKTRDALRERPETILARLREKIDILLVDEFQDTDPVQAEILGAIAGEDQRSGRLFLVGDVKQSIYRFRGARPKVFDEFREQLPDEGRLALTENFRSRPEIISFVNAVFADVYPDPDDRLVADPKRPARDVPEAIEFLWPASREANGDKRDATQARDDDSYAKRRDEAARIARKIKTILDRQRLVWDRDEKKDRPVRSGDVAILFRSLSDVHLYEDALADEGLNSLTIGGSVFYSRQEIIDLGNLLSTIVDPTDELALAGTLRGPFFCASDNAIFWLAAAKRGDFIDNFEHWSDIEEFLDIDRRSIARAHEQLTRLRAEKATKSIAGLIETAIEESGYEASLLGEFQGERKRANVRKLIDTARRFDRRGGLTLADFVARLRDFLDHPPREEAAASTDEEGDAVRLMSIHASKGLEFPVVVLPDLDRKPNVSRSTGGGFDDRVGPVVRLGINLETDDDSQTSADDSPRGLGSTLNKIRANREEEAEAIRLFYVAVTRARDLLILSAREGIKQRYQSYAMRLLAERYNLETGRCQVALPVGIDAPIALVEFAEAAERPSSIGGGPREAPLLRLSNAILVQPCALADSITRPAVLLPRRAPKGPIHREVEAEETEQAIDTRFLDLDPALREGPRRSKLARLVRETLTDPNGVEPSTLDAALRRAARCLDFSPSTRLENEAFETLARLLTDPEAARIARAPKSARMVRWVADRASADGWSIRGVLDGAIRSDDGTTELFCVGFAPADDPFERLRIALSAALAPRLGLGAVDRAWLLAVDLQSSRLVEQRADKKTIASLLEELKNKR